MQHRPQQRSSEPAVGDLIVMSGTRTPRCERLDPDHSAEIHFFTGVRYYRMSDEVLAQASASVAMKPVRRRRRSAKAAANVAQPRVECLA